MTLDTKWFVGERLQDVLDLRITPTDQDWLEAIDVRPVTVEGVTGITFTVRVKKHDGTSRTVFFQITERANDGSPVLWFESDRYMQDEKFPNLWRYTG